MHTTLLRKQVLWQYLQQDRHDGRVEVSPDRRGGKVHLVLHRHRRLGGRLTLPNGGAGGRSGAWARDVRRAGWLAAAGPPLRQRV